MDNAFNKLVDEQPELAKALIEHHQGVKGSSWKRARKAKAERILRSSLVEVMEGLEVRETGQGEDEYGGR